MNNKKIMTLIFKKVTSLTKSILLQTNNFLAMELPPFDNTDDSTMGVEFWIIQKFTSSKSM